MKKLKNRVVLDTSIQLELAKYQKFEEELQKILSADFNLKESGIYASSYSSYEYRTGLIFQLIQFYLLVEVSDNVSTALATLSDGFGRVSKYGLIALSVISRLDKSIQTDNKDEYLRQLEFAILFLDRNFYFKTSGITGSFEKNPFSRFLLSSANDFKDFYKLVITHKVLRTDEFWNRNSSQLQTLIKDHNLKKNYDKMHKKLCIIHKNPDICKKLVRINQGIGDAVIASDLRYDEILLTTDASFGFLCPPLGKRHLKVAKPIPSKLLIE